MAISDSFRFLTAALAAAVVASCTTTARSPSSGAPVTARPYGIPGLPHSAADVHFMTGMIHHHAQAVVMANWAPTHGASPELQRLAQRIAVAQNDEIALMQAWLKDKGEPVPDAKPGPMHTMTNGMEHEVVMPGMLNDAQLKQLDEARGIEFDRLFLTFMIQHHEGAVTMVDALFGSPGAGQDDVVFRFASDVYADQSTEIDRTEKMLDARPQPASSKSLR